MCRSEGAFRFYTSHYFYKSFIHFRSTTTSAGISAKNFHRLYLGTFLYCTIWASITSDIRSAQARSLFRSNCARWTLFSRESTMHWRRKEAWICCWRWAITAWRQLALMVALATWKPLYHSSGCLVEAQIRSPHKLSHQCQCNKWTSPLLFRCFWDCQHPRIALAYPYCLYYALLALANCRWGYHQKLGETLLEFIDNLRSNLLAQSLMTKPWKCELKAFWWLTNEVRALC